MSDIRSLLFSTFVKAVTLGRDRALSVLIFHRVLPHQDPFRRAEPTVPEFDRQMRLLRRYFTPVSLAEGIAGLKTGDLPPRPACVTFDDGYANNLTHALPVLQEHAIPATIFVSSDFLDGSSMWNDQIIEAFRSVEQEVVDLTHIDLKCYETDCLQAKRAAAYDVINTIKYRLPSERREVIDALSEVAPHETEAQMLTPGQLRQLHGEGVEIGAHTCSHPILERLPDDEARREILQGKQALEEALGAPVRFFAYPNGRYGRDYSERHARMVQECHFEAAVTTNPGVSVSQTDVFQLPRFTPWDTGNIRYLARLAGNMRQQR